MNEKARKSERALSSYKQTFEKFRVTDESIKLHELDL